MKSSPLIALVVAIALCGCDTPDQILGNCKMEAASKVGPTGGEKGHLSTAFLYDEYLDGCLGVRGYKLEDGKAVVRR